MQKLAYSVEYHLFIYLLYLFDFYFLLFFVPRDDDLIEAVEMDMDDNANDVERDQKIIGQRATYSLTPTLAGRLCEDHLPLNRIYGKPYRRIDCDFFVGILNFSFTLFIEIKFF